MATLDLYNVSGEKIDTLEVNASVFGIEPKKHVLHEVLTAELAASRQGTASTKTRGFVRGGGRKPFKQKGTGRARQGTIRAPHMKGGGVVFGPHPRDFDKKVNKKVRKLAIRSALSEKVLKGEVILLENTIDTVKTQNIVNFLNKIGTQKTLFVISDFLNDKEWNLYLSTRNIKTSFVLDKSELSVYWLLKQDKIILTIEALKSIEEVLA